MNRRRFLTSVPVLAAYGFVTAMVGRVFGSERRKRMSAGALRREPWRMAGGDAGVMRSWEDGPGVDIMVYYCETCKRDRAFVETTLDVDDKTATLTLECGHVLTFTDEEWRGVVTEDPEAVAEWMRTQKGLT